MLKKLSQYDQTLLENEIHFQKADSHDFGRHADLPHGVIHADLFRDNALWDGENFSGIIDFYYSCDDVLLYDLAVSANDWCTNDDFSLDKDKVHALLTHYNTFRELTAHERDYWPSMLRAGALRFWLSRLHDKHFPRPGELVHTKNPDEFKSILIDRINNSDRYLDYWI